MQVVNIVKSKLVTSLIVIRDAVVFGAFIVLLIAFMFGFFSGI